MTNALDSNEIERGRQLLAFLKDRDESCPSCGYNLRDLTQPVCPECRQALVLTVGVRPAETLWILLTAAPSIFSGICTLLLSIPMVLDGGGAPWFIVWTFVFGLVSGLSGLALIQKRREFVRLKPRIQAICALSTWLLHIGVFLFLVWIVLGL